MTRFADPEGGVRRFDARRAGWVLVLALLASCRSGVLDPDLVRAYPPLTRFLLDEFQDARPATGTGRLVAGAAVVDVSPTNYRVWISGFGAGRISTGVRDPVTARAFFLDDGFGSIVLVSLDLTGLPRLDVERIRALVSQRFRERIIVTATHNHQAPDTIGYWGFGPGFPLESGIVREYQDELLHKTADCIDRAIASAVPARLLFGRATIPEGYSINLWFPDDPGRKDNEMGVIRAVDASGAAIATLVNWPCHAEAQLGKGHKISAEFPGQFYKANDAAGGGVGLFFQGALGGMVTPRVNRPELQRKLDLAARLAFNEELGGVLAAKANEAVGGAAPMGFGDARLAMVRREIEIPVENAIFKLAGQTGILPDAGRVDPEKLLLRTEVGVVELGPATIATIPGEAFPSLGFAIKERMAAPYRFVLGLAGDEVGYLMTPEEYADRTYKYERSASLGPRAGSIVRDALLGLIDEIQGASGQSLGAPLPE
jgi:hypothetical protein